MTGYEKGGIPIWPQLPLAGLALIAGYCDWRWRRVPNALVAPAALLGLAGWAVQGGVPGLWHSLAGLAVGLAVLIVPWALGWVGGGDVKFLAAVGALGGAPFVIHAALAGMVLGGVWALAALVQRNGAQWCLARGLSWAMGAVSWPAVRQGGGDSTVPPMPYTVPLAAGVVAALILAAKGWW